MSQLSPSSLVDYILEMACAIQQIQAPTFQEDSRAEWIKQHFILESLSNVFRDQVGNLFALIPGGEAAPLVVSAHLDTVHPRSDSIPLSRLKNRINGPGIGDNSLGLAALLGVARWSQQIQYKPPGDLWLVATVGEEGLGNLYGMQAVVERFTNHPLAYLVLEGIGLGNLNHRALGVERYKISIRTTGGHSWADYGTPSAVHELARLIVSLTALSLPRNPRTTLNVGIIQGGSSVNTIAAHAHLEIDLRSEDHQSLKRLVRRVQRRVKRLERPGIHLDMELIGRRPAGEISANHPLVSLAQALLQKAGITPHLSIASTDANFPLSRGLPALCFGLTTGGNTHSEEEYIEVEPLRQGLKFLLNMIQSIWKLP